MTNLRFGIIFLLGAFFITVLGIAGVIVLDARSTFQNIVLVAPTPTVVIEVARREVTDIPVISAIPPSPTPTNTPTPTATPTPTPTPTNTPTYTPVPPTLTPTRYISPTPTAQRCISVVGDSVAHGDAVFEIPGTGYFNAQLAPVSAFIQQLYTQRGDSMKVYNRSVSAVGISSPRYPSYFGTVEYAQLLKDGCQYTVILAWLNDLSSDIETTTAAYNHAQSLGSLVKAVLNATPSTTVIVLNYYNAVAAPFALNTFAPGFTPGNVGMFNQQMTTECIAGVLKSPRVRCVDSNSFGIGSFVMGTATMNDLLTILTQPVTAEAQALLNAYFGANPSGVVIGDGVHLSNAGKAQLASQLVPLMP